MKYTFLILHYMVANETEQCVDSIIKNFCHDDIRIVIVDNKSPNESGKAIKSKYADLGFVDVIFNNSNEGFAKGNNYGFEYIKKNYQTDFIIAMNNDVAIEDCCFLSKIKEIYEKNKFYILGPDIYSTTFEAHQSPKRLTHYSVVEVCNLVNKYQKQLKNKWIIRIKCMLKKSFNLRKLKYQHQRSHVDWRKGYENVPLHGACLIFSKEYINKMEYLFYPETFFYYETEILDYLCNCNNMKTMYSPEIAVLHHQNVATDNAYNNMFEKTLFAIQCNTQSTKAFLDLMKK